MITYGIIFFATFCIIKSADSVDSQVQPGSCSLKNICLKQLPEPTMNATSLIKSETFRLKSWNFQIHRF